ncbi:2-succinyl-6-hydroxy-2,4-cyclohexadiene-1-carboxylate synthase [Bhargavaea ginsengi]|uniref:Putative 2-succinyl-6-hydroxy-2,4-cyclohexadiene-1-carboxylate synthase n=1 Tax=Bhargavaea ginsengi TaxID=426757 RepID=A0A1H6Y332_9BACL|nr:2-succinyl-6-hydroxy-2,4-cyclohexadiene-1-carboxylate synthase [Bhargavaea ginsengi]SEJ34846.1 2-succinyl-6-hydroxy-2,4-cyclohexadiene-1-carboxylate synthase [Bhargavaea ginsengi]
MEPLKAMIRGIQIGYREAGDPDGNPLVLLHGFTGSSASWTGFADEFGSCRLIMPDLTGHGHSAAPDVPGRYAMEEQVADLDVLFTGLGLDRFSLLGYSMGGRIAIGYAAKHPEKISRLILESTSPGLETKDERLSRRESDDKLAAFIEREGIRAFTDRWENIPLFASQTRLPKDVRERVRSGRLGNEPAGLAGSLRGIGTGSQPSYWDNLKGFKMPVTLITGGLDEKYVNIAEDMARQLPNSSHVTVPDAGHTVHVENPVRFATIVKEAIKP